MAGPIGRPTKAAADERTLIDDILTCQFGHIVRIIAFNTTEGWSQDVTEDIAREVAEVARQRGTVLRDGALELVYRFFSLPA